MNSKFKKSISICMATLLSTSMLAAVGCGGNEGPSSDSEIKPTSNNTFYTISAYDGGYGQEWLKKLCNELMFELKDVSFEPGKKGVYIDIVGDKSETEDADVKGGSTDVDLYISSSGDPSKYLGVSGGKIDFNNVYAYDITEILNRKVFNSDGEVEFSEDKTSFKTSDINQSLLDRMDEEIVDTWNFGKATGAPSDEIYYFLPFEDVPCGYIIDWDFMKEQGLDNGTGIEGMPGTMEEFYSVLERLQGYFSGWTAASGIHHYLSCFENSIRAKVDGVEKFKDMTFFLNDSEGYDFNGNGTIEEDEKISFDVSTPKSSNAYLATQTSGYKAAIEFTMKMNWRDGSNTYYDSEAFKKSFRDMQKDFVMSKESTKRQRIAMIYEGEWWENEVQAIFRQMGSLNADNDYGKRDFRMMPCPAVSENDAESKYLLSSKATSIIFVNPNSVKAGSVKEKLTEMVLQYIFSRHGLATLNTTTSITMPAYKYTLTDEEYKSLTKFGQWMYRLNYQYTEEYRYFRVSAVERFIKNPALFVRNIPITYKGPLLNVFNTYSRDGKLYDKTVDWYVDDYQTYYKNLFSNMS